MEEVFNNAIDTLSDEDKQLPQVEHVLPLLKKGQPPPLGQRIYASTSAPYWYDRIIPNAVVAQKL